MLFQVVTMSTRNDAILDLHSWGNGAARAQSVVEMGAALAAPL